MIDFIDDKSRQPPYEFDFLIPSWSSWKSTLFSSMEFDLAENDIQYGWQKIRVTLIPISWKFWLQSFGFLCLQSIFNIVVAFIVYYCVVQPRRRHKMKERQSFKDASFSVISYTTVCNNTMIFGYGIVCPLLLIWPLFLFDKILQFQNVALMLCLVGAVPNLLLLRVMEALHGGLPTFCYNDNNNNNSETNSSLRMLILYFSATLQFQFDHETQQPIPLTPKVFYRKVCIFVSVFCQTSILYSILLTCNYQVFPQPTTYDSDLQLTIDKPPYDYVTILWHFFHPGKLANSLLMASLLSCILEGGASGLGLLFSLCTGLVLEDFADSPLTKSTSPSDFWGRRWDRPVASALKRGLFRPLRQAGVSRNLSSFLTFCVSAIIHEYVLYFMSLRQQPSAIGQTTRWNGIIQQDYNYWQSPTRGRQGLFFLVNGIVLVLERILKQKSTKLSFLKCFFCYLKTFPQPVRTVFVLLLVLPIAHWFTDEYIQNSFFADASLGFPIIIIDLFT